MAKKPSEAKASVYTSRSRTAQEEEHALLSLLFQAPWHSLIQPFLT